MPDFATAPTGWTVDRYTPASFGNVGTFQGRDNVLGIGISSAQGLSSRPAGFQSQFYDTQGKSYALSGGAGSILSADLWIDSAWLAVDAGNVRTDMWGVMTDGVGVTDYPIIGFTNYGEEGARFRVWDENLDNPSGGWVDLATSVTGDAWVKFAIEFTGNSYKYFINGVNVFSDTVVNDSTGFSAVIMQAYNFYDSVNFPDGNPVNYVAHWSNSQPVPEPSTFALIGLGMGALAVGAYRRKKSA
jgi:hypothetical protein